MKPRIKVKNPSLKMTAGSITGLILFGYSIFKQAPKYYTYIEENPEIGRFERFKHGCRVFWPSFIIGGCTVACEIGNYKYNMKQHAALAGALAISETALVEYKDYKDKVGEVLGEKAQEQVEEELAKDALKKTPPSEELLANYDQFRFGEQLFLDKYSGQFFWSTTEAIRQASEEMLDRCHMNMFVSFNEFVREVDSQQFNYTDYGDDVGWNAEHPIRVNIKYDELPDKPGVVAGVITYRERPRSEYSDLHGPLYSF